MLQFPAVEFEKISFTSSSTNRPLEGDDVGEGAQARSSAQSLAYTSLSTGVLLRASIPFGLGLRGYVALDAERVLSRLSVASTSSSTPALPLWGAGFSLGVAWRSF
jgi:hypothetical protein